MKKMIAAFLCLSCLFMACKKDNDNTPIGITGVWMFVSSESKTSNSNGVVSHDTYMADDADVLKLDQNGIYKSIVGGEAEQGKWKLSEDGKTLTIDIGTAYESAMTVLSHTKTALVLYGKDVDGDYIFETTIRLKR
jgi:hypothetical protein